jgi:hypothetical protein
MEDYTQLPPKVLIERGETGECPVCQRIGVIEKREGKVRYIHGSVWEVGEGPPKITNDICSLT